MPWQHPFSFKKIITAINKTDQISFSNKLNFWILRISWVQVIRLVMNEKCIKDILFQLIQTKSQIIVQQLKPFLKLIKFYFWLCQTIVILWQVIRKVFSTNHKVQLSLSSLFICSNFEIFLKFCPETVLRSPFHNNHFYIISFKIFSRICSYFSKFKDKISTKFRHRGR